MTQPAIPQVTGPAARRAVRYEQATIAYNIGEGIIAIGAGLAAGSIALLGFGFDSWIEVAAATIVLWRLRAELRGGRTDQASSAARCGSWPSPSSCWPSTSSLRASATCASAPHRRPLRLGSR
jgi:hypothetical protein